MHVIIGSQNPNKVNAVKRVFAQFFPQLVLNFHSVDVPSGVSPQPIEWAVIVQGAKNRAMNAYDFFRKNVQNFTSNLPPNSEPFFSVGIEAGLAPVPSTISGYLDFQICAIYNQNQQLSLGSGPGWEYPPQIVQALLKSPDLELGTIMGKISGDPQIGHHNGAIGYYSHQILARSTITEIAIQMALIPQLNPHEYFP